MKVKHIDRHLTIKAVSETGTFSGYGSVYGNIDQADDIILSGAFADSLAESAAKGSMPALLWQHDSREPIGAYTSIKEDENGLLVEGQLCMDTQRGREAYALMKMGAISGLSVGFMCREDSYDHKTGIRTIIKGDLWEVSLVTFPCNDSARVSSVKSFEEITDFKSAERFLRDSCSVSRSDAVSIVARIKCLALRDSEADAAAKRLLDALNGRKSLITA